MAEKIFNCERCGKEKVLSREGTAFAQVQYRLFEDGTVWEGKPKVICRECFNEYQEWYNNGMKGDESNRI
jgi:hypothetical protein